MNTNKFVTETILRKPRLLLSLSNSALHEEIFRQLSSRFDIEIVSSSLLISDTPLSTEIDIILYFLDEITPGSDTSTIVQNLYKFCRLAVSNQARLLLILPENLSYKSEIVTLVNQSSKTTALSYQLYEVSSAVEIYSQSLAIIKSFLYDFKPLPESKSEISVIAPEASSSPLVTQLSQTLSLPHIVPDPDLLKKTVSKKPKKFSLKFVAPRISHFRFSLSSPIFSIITVFFLIPWVLFLIQILFLTSVLSCSQASLKKGDIPRTLLCSKAASLVSSVARYEYPYVLGSNFVFTKFGYPLTESFQLSSSIADAFQIAALTAEKVNQLAAAYLGASSDSPADSLPETSALLNSLNESLSFVQADLRNYYLTSTRPPAILNSFTSQIVSYRLLVSQLQALAPDLPPLLSFNKKTNYLVLLQDNTEIRPTGGFLDSFALVSAENGKLLGIQTFLVSSADSQLRGQVDPPSDFKQVTSESQWYLRDSNWNSDLPDSAKRIAWFVEKELNRTSDVVIFTNLHFLQELLTVTGPLKVPGLSQPLTSQTFLSQYMAHLGTGPVVSDSFILDAASVLQEKVTSFSRSQLNSFMLSLSRQLNTRQLAIVPLTFTAPGLISTGWTGEATLPACRSQLPCLHDYYYVVDSNVGVNKTDIAIKRTKNLQTTLALGVLESVLELSYTNSSPQSSWPLGNYKDYLRLYFPQSLGLTDLQVNNQSVPRSQLNFGTAKGLTSVGYLINLPPGAALQVKAFFRQNYNPVSQFHYQADLPNQFGLDSQVVSSRILYPSNWFVTSFNQPQVASPGDVRYNSTQLGPVKLDIDFAPR